MELTTLFGQIDDFWADFEAEYYQHLMQVEQQSGSGLSIISHVMNLIANRSSQN